MLWSDQISAYVASIPTQMTFPQGLLSPYVD